MKMAKPPPPPPPPEEIVDGKRDNEREKVRYKTHLLPVVSVLGLNLLHVQVVDEVDDLQVPVKCTYR